MGAILVRVFAVASINGISGLVEGNRRLLGVQALGTAICSAYSFIVTYGVLKLINVFTPVRVPDAAEAKGLDAVFHGETTYDFS